MTDSPFLPLLNRQHAIKSVQKYYTQIELLEDLVNFGSALMPRLLPDEAKTPTDSLLVFQLAREVILQIDTLQVLLANGCIPGASSVCRSLVEKQHLCLWSLSGDLERKMQHLFVGGLRSDRQRARAAMSGQKENDALGALRHQLAQTQIPEQSAQRVKAIDARLKLSDVTDINSAFDKLAVKLGYDPSWTAVYCSNRNQNKHRGSARKIAEEIGKLADYQIYYTDYSTRTHGQAVLSNISIGDGYISVSNIRDVNDFETTYFLAINSAFELYKALLEHYLPDEVQAYCAMAIKNWMPRRLR